KTEKSSKKKLFEEKLTCKLILSDCGESSESCEEDMGKRNRSTASSTPPSSKKPAKKNEEKPRKDINSNQPEKTSTENCPSSAGSNSSKNGVSQFLLFECLSF